MEKRIVMLLTGLLIYGCTAFDDAEPTSRTLFMYFYGSAESYIGKVAELDADGGFIIAANIPSEDGNSNAIIIKTDARGVNLWETPFENTRIQAIKPYNGGYLIVGDSIKINANPEDISEIENTKARLISMDDKGNIIREWLQGETLVISATPLVTREVDYHANAVTVDKNGNILVLGSRKAPGANERSFVASISPTTFAVNWSQQYGLVDRDYLNCNSVFITPTDQIVWASKTFRSLQNLSEQYVSVSFVEPNSTFANNSLFGENEGDRNHIAEDIQSTGGSYLITGTYADQAGRNGNIYFLKVDLNGNIVDGSVRYFDGETLELGTENRNASLTEDTGNSVTAVNGGYVIAGTIESSVNTGNGGRDIILIKIDLQGNFVWSELIGGAGDQFAQSVRRTPDGGLLICGTNSVNGLSTVMIIRTNEFGKIQD